MKRIVSLCLVITFLCCVLTACSGSKPSSAQSQGSNTAKHVHSFTYDDTPQSSAISEIGYCYGCETLSVTFLSSGSTYLYYDFPQSEWRSFRNASSIGSYYNKYIKGQYRGTKLY